MEQNLIISTLITLIFFAITFGEMKYVSKNVRPIKELIKETILVYISSFLGLFLISKLNLFKKVATEGPNVTQVLVDKPEF
mgnify:CR=1 FL=1|tara:strand:+ start:540 stop:782 length:243 start_codon:yes stop_codon:yes gene_type:complete